jgi:hypothetical protein
LSVTYGRSVVFSAIPGSSTNKTDRHHITEILLKVALNTITLSLYIINFSTFRFHLWCKWFICLSILNGWWFIYNSCSGVLCVTVYTSTSETRGHCYRHRRKRRQRRHQSRRSNGVISRISAKGLFFKFVYRDVSV